MWFTSVFDVGWNEACCDGKAYHLLFFRLSHWWVPKGNFDTSPSPFIWKFAFSCCFKDIACDKCRGCILKGFQKAERKGLDRSFHLAFTKCTEKGKMWESMHRYWWRPPPPHTPMNPDANGQASLGVAACSRLQARFLKWWNLTDYLAGHRLNWNTSLMCSRISKNLGPKKVSKTK